MRTKRLGKTDFDLSVLGLGAWAFGGGDWAFGWGPQDDAESIAAIHRAVRRGINWIDTAAVYGLGHSEEVVGRAIAAIPRSERPRVFTKCGLVWKKKKIQQRLDAESIRREAEASLQRLGVESIDLYQIHWPNESSIEEAWAALADLRREGKVRHIGVSNFDVGQLERIREVVGVESLQPPYSLARREIESGILPYCFEREIGVIVYSPMESGLLTGKMTRERIETLPESDWRKSKGDEFKEPKLSRNLEIAERLRPVAARLDTSPGAVAVAWTLRNPAVTGAIVGARRPDQLDEILAAADIALDEEDARALELTPSVRS
ncbi:MAG: aldo/keto reductase [Vicinamibacteria bacterium]